MGESANLQAFQAELSRARKFIRGDILKGVASLCCDNPKCAAGLVRISFCEERGSRALHSAATHFLSLARRELPEPDPIELAAGEPGRGGEGV